MTDNPLEHPAKFQSEKAEPFPDFGRNAFLPISDRMGNQQLQHRAQADHSIRSLGFSGADELLPPELQRGGRWHPSSSPGSDEFDQSPPRGASPVRPVMMPSDTVTKIPYKDGGFMEHEVGAVGHRMTDSPDAASKARKLQTHLEDQYHVTFSGPGSPDAKYGNESYKCRQPTLGELRAVEQALYKSQPAHQYKDGAVHFSFTEGRAKEGTTAWYNPGEVVVGPGMGRDSFLQERTYDSLAHGSMEQVIMHELAHNSSQKRGAVDGRTYGFWKIHDTTDGGKTAPVLESSKKVDKSSINEVYKKVGDSWVPCELDGKPMGAPISAEEMRSRAKIKPATDYFTNGTEVEAEALSALRLGGKSRERLRDEFPDLYKIAVQQDQEEITKAYGPNYVRLSSGRLVKRSTSDAISMRGEH